MPYIASQHLGNVTLGIFTVGIVAAAFSSADSALTALTTSFCVDILDMKPTDDVALEKKNVITRRWVHIIISAVFVLIILLIKAIGSDSIITAIYKLASYTYGPLLGLYFAGLYTKLKPIDKYVPYVAIAAPIICFAIEMFSLMIWNYQVGYELLLINAALTGAGIWLLSSMNKKVL